MLETFTQRAFYTIIQSRKKILTKLEAGEGVCPEKHMKRALNICCCALALALLLGGCVQTAQQEQEAEPVLAASEIEREPAEPEYLQHAAYMSAPKGFFGPDQPLRRAEAAQLVCNLAGLSPENPPESGYTDVLPDAWYYGAVCAAAEYFEAPAQTPETATEPEPETADTENPDAPQTPEAEPSYFRPTDAALAYELQGALTRALDLSDPALPAGMSDMTVLSRADAAVLVNRLLGRTPDRDALDTLCYDLLLDMPRTDARYAEVLEAVLPHEYLEDTNEQWNMQTLAASPMRAGAHTKDGRGFVVDETGCVVRETGIFTSGGWTYLSDSDTGCIFADGALHRTDGHVVLSLRGGQLLQDGAQGEYLFDENGYYTTGSEEIDALLDEAIAACTTQDMTPEQMLRACYDYVRGYKYLGRNAAFGSDVKTPPYEKLLEFAQKILSTGKGDCYNFAASFCLLARRLGFEAECIIGECGYVWNWRPIAHGWVEITKDGQTLLYDPQIENYNIRAGISNDDYGAYAVRYETAHARYLKH